MNNVEHTPLEKGVMQAIRTGRILQRPRWKFVLSGVLAALGGIIIFLTLLYIASFAIFMLRQSGALFVPVFGMRGFLAFFADVPVVLVILLALFTTTLEILVRRYRMGYRMPLLVSAGAILAVVVVGGYALERTEIHAQLLHVAREAGLPPPFAALYESSGHPAPDIYHGAIASFFPGGFILIDNNGAGTTTVLIDARTRLPFGSDFNAGEDVVVFGDRVGTSTIHAFGVRDTD